jgi:hypothetical protein
MFEPAEEVKENDARKSVVKWHKEEHSGNYNTDVNPFGRIVQKKIQKYADSDGECNCETIAHVHRSLIESWFRLEPHRAVRARFIHPVKFSEIGSRKSEYFPFTTPRAAAFN